MKTFQLNDVLVRHNVAGIADLQIQLRGAGGVNTTFQMPLYLGADIRESAMALRRMATMLERHLDQQNRVNPCKTCSGHGARHFSKGTQHSVSNCED